MTTLNQLPEVLQQLFETEANQLARESHFIERQREWSGAQFAQTLVFGWLENPRASLSELQQMAMSCGCKVSIKNIATRLKEAEASVFMQRLLATGLALAQQRTPPTSGGAFEEVVLLDSTQVSLPQSFHDAWPGGGNQNQVRAGMKIQTTYEWRHGQVGFTLHPAVTNDRKLPRIALNAGSLVVHDSGFLSVARCRHVEAQAAYWLARVSAQMGVVDVHGQYGSLHAFLQQQDEHTACVDQWVGLTHQHHPVRLLALRLPPEVVEARQARLRADCQRRYGRVPSDASLALCAWCVLATNAPDSLLPADQAFCLYRSRWQIELLFKLWKQHGALDEWRTHDPQRLLTELYAKLLMLLVQHWLLIETCWHFNDRSLVKALRWLRRHLVTLISLLADPPALHAFLLRLADGMDRCRTAKRKKRLAFFQLAEALFDVS